jgi:hypothetical protein
LKLARGVAQWIWLLRVSRASQSRLQGEEKERTMNAGCLATCSGWFAEWEPDGFFWKMSQGSFLWGSDVYSESFPKQGTMQNGFVYEHQKQELRTAATDGSVWHNQEPLLAEIFSDLKEKDKIESNMGEKQTWATPTATMMSDNMSPEKWMERMEKRMEEQKGVYGIPLEVQVKLEQQIEKSKQIEDQANLQKNEWYTPTAVAEAPQNFGKSGTGFSLYTQASFHHPPEQTNGEESRIRLNPLFTEWLMGLPVGWTDFEALEMGLYLSKLRLHFKSLCKDLYPEK